MNFYESFSMAVKNIRSNKTRSILTMLGIIIGVAAVIIITGLGNGMEKYMKKQFESMGTNVMYVNVWGRDYLGMSVEDLQKIVDGCEYVDKVTPSVSFSGSKKIGTENLDTTNVIGVSEEYIDITSKEVTDGRNIKYMDIKNRNNVCLIGSYISNKYFSGKGVGENIKINGRNFTIIGTVGEKADSTEYSPDDEIIMPYTTMGRMINKRKFDNFTVAFKDESKAAEARVELENAITNFFNGDPDTFYVQSMTEMLEMMNRTTSIMITILTIIASISLLVGGIGIMNIMLVSVTERTKEIGIRKALGAKERYIMRQFVIEAGTTSAIGGSLGIIVGYIGSAIFTKVISVVFNETLVVLPTILAVLVSFGISAGIGVFFGYMPAKKAAKLNPIDALRYD